MYFYVNASSKDKPALLSFLKLVSKIEDKSIKVKFLQKKTNKKFITVLKSPHVNKSAQEQFEYRIYTTKILVNSFKPFKFISTIKKLNNICLPGVSLKIDSLSQTPKQFQNNLKEAASPSNFKLYYFEKKSHILKSCAIKNYLKIFDAYGKFILKNF